MPMKSDQMTRKKIGVYVHWPFCQSLCPYCDFNSHIATQKTNNEEWINAYKAQIDHQLSLIEASQISLVSIFFGGGTPSLMDPLIAEEIISYICAIFNKKPSSIEITLENNPSSFENKKVAKFYESGVNRFSVGVQSFNNLDLKNLGRLHSADDAKNAIKTLQQNKYSYSFDLIFGRQMQTLSSWQDELNFAQNFTKNHISLYQLTIEKGTKFYSMHRKGELILPNANELDRIYEYTQKFMEEQGFERYEVSNYCKNNEFSRHNMLYWESDDYIGIGPGSYGRVMNRQGERLELVSIHNPYKWLNNLKDNKEEKGLQKVTAINKSHTAEEAIMMGSRIKQGINFDEQSDKLKVDIKKHINKDGYKFLVENGFLKNIDNSLIPTKKGLSFAEGISKKLLIS